MSYEFPRGGVAETIITPWSRQSIGTELFGMGLTSASSQNWIAVSTAVYIPFWVPEPSTITKIGWCNGSAVAGNYDAGVWREDQTLVISTGSTGAAGVSVAQAVDVTDTTIPRGRYYMGMTSDTSGATQKIMAAVPAAGIAQALGLLEDGVVIPITTNANPAVFAKYTRAFVPCMFVQLRRAVGP